MARKPWDDVFGRVRVVKSPRYVYLPRPTASDLDAEEKELGCRLPASYRAFAERFGLGGEWAGEIRVYQSSGDEGKCLTVTGRSRYWRDYFAAARLAPADSSGDFAKRLIVFGDEVGEREFVFHPGRVTTRQPLEYEVGDLAPIFGWQSLPLDSFSGFLVAASESACPRDGVEIQLRIDYSLFNGECSPFSKRDINSWLDANNKAARSLALAIRSESRPDLFPVLGDALEDAGCDSEHVLRACRDGNPQADGGWVLAVLLGEAK